MSLLAAPLAFGASVLFPRPLHLVRQVDDPISKTTATIDEYCAGNRVVTVRGSKVTIADYDAQQLTEIDHSAQTWSVTPFAEIASSRAALEARMHVAPRAMPASRPVRLMASASRTAGAVDTFVAEEPQRRLEVGIDRHVVLSRAAAEVLIGAAYPGRGSEEEDAILDAAGNGSGVSVMSAGAASTAGRTNATISSANTSASKSSTPASASSASKAPQRSSNVATVNASGVSSDAAASATASSEPLYGLVTERTLTIESGGTTLVAHNKIVRIGDELPPADAMLIDPGAKRVESRTTRLARELREIESLPSANVQH